MVFFPIGLPRRAEGAHGGTGSPVGRGGPKAPGPSAEGPHAQGSPVRRSGAEGSPDLPQKVPAPPRACAALDLRPGGPGGHYLWDRLLPYFTNLFQYPVPKINSTISGKTQVT